MSDDAQSATPKLFFPRVMEEDYAALSGRVNVNDLRGSRWLVLGATGLVPSYLVNFLAWLQLEAGIPLGGLHVWVRSAAKAETRFPWMGKVGASVHVPDWNNPSNESFPEVDFVLHAASPATPTACAADPYGLMACNGHLSQRLVEAYSRSALRAALYLSSSEVYGTGTEERPIEEELGQVDPSSPRSLYPQAKRLGESVFFEAARASDLPVRIARLFHTYGPGLDLKRDSRAFAALIAMIARGESIQLRGDGRARRAYCYLADTTAALLTLALCPKAPLVANVGNAEAILSVLELAQLLTRLSGLSSDIECAEKGEAQSLAGGIFPNTAKLESLGWQPRTCAEEGFRRTLQHHIR